MDRAEFEQMRRQVAANPVIAKLQQAAQDLLGGTMLVLLRKRDKVIEVHPFHEEDGLPEFCRLYRSSPEGMECCTTCRSLMALGTCYRGTIEYECHGGVIIIASPAAAVPDDDIQPVIASCAFTRADREQGWGELRDHARGLGIDLRRLRAAYDRMPVLTDERRKIAGALVEVAAAALGRQPDPADSQSTAQPPPAEQSPEATVESLVEKALYIAHTQSAKDDEVSHGELLAQQISEVVARNPTVPFSVKNIAAAARISPNHFSTIFSKATGTPFTVFLLDLRISRSKQLLRDLTLRIGAVAELSGFPDAGYFTRRFRKATGMTPTQWRNSV
jgi:AraC-like DNA-binding protein